MAERLPGGKAEGRPGGRRMKPKGKVVRPEWNARYSGHEAARLYAPRSKVVPRVNPSFGRGWPVFLFERRYAYGTQRVFDHGTFPGL